MVGKNQTNEQRQVNLVDNISITAGQHQLKFGVDYRWLSPIASPLAYSQFVEFAGMTGPDGALSGMANAVQVFAAQGSTVLSKNFSLYGQDSFKITARLTLTYGLRWDVNPALKGKSAASELFTVEGLNDPATMTLAPRGTPLYATTWGNIAPRLGLAYSLTQRSGLETVLRGGFGIFYDLGSGSLGNVTFGFPFLASGPFLFNVPFPLTPQQAAPPPFSLTPPVGSLFVAEPNLKLPRTYQWNLAVEQSLGANQTVSGTYVGAIGRNLLRQDSLFEPNQDFGFVQVTRNTATSDYHALQLKFQRRLANGLQALASYTYAHSIDIASNDSFAFNTPSSVSNSNLDRGDSDFDVRHSFTGALTYNVPTPTKNRIVRRLLEDWSTDGFVIARTAVPVNLTASDVVIAGTFFASRPDIIPGVPFYLYGSQEPGGKAINPNAFAVPPQGQQGNLGRNALRGFGAWQADFALHRQFHLNERFGVQFRTEFFNIFNHPNFGNPTVTTLGQPLFGQSTTTLASSLGGGGLNGGFNPLYQIGGPRSIQLAMKLQF